VTVAKDINGLAAHPLVGREAAAGYIDFTSRQAPLAAVFASLTQRQRAAELLEFVTEIARLKSESEIEDGMSGDDAVDTLNNLISSARALTARSAL
jgi:hypothetical protein